MSDRNPKYTFQKKEDKKPLNIYQKLVEVRKSVGYLKKEASGFKYSYATESQVLSAIKPKMDELNLLLEIDMLSLEQFDFPQWHKDSKQFVIGKGLKAVFEFRWVDADNPSDFIVKKMTLQNDGIDAKSIGGLYTYANRYFLMKQFQIASDNLDPDEHQKKIEACQPQQNYVNEDQITELELQVNGYDNIRNKLMERFGGDFSKMTIQQFGLAKTWVDVEINKEKKNERE